MTSNVAAVEDIKYSKIDGLLVRPAHLAMLTLLVGILAFRWLLILPI